MTTIDPRLAGVIASALGIDESAIDETAGVDRTERWDSFGHLRVILDIESVFGVRFEMSQIPELKTAALLQGELEKREALTSA